MTYWKLNEDPMYDEDGILVDEDADLKVIEEEIKRQAPEACYIMDCDPYSTINS